VSELGRLLRWYPEVWRSRYGEELEALLEDELAGRPPSRRLRLSLALAGLRERAHAAALVGGEAPPTERARAGVLVVLGAWSAFILAGASYEKLAEHFAGALPAAHRSVPQSAFDVVVGAAVLAGVLSVLGVALSGPAFARSLRSGAWPALRRHVVRAGAVTALALAGVAALVPWAHGLTSAQRNGGDASYGAAFLTVAACGAVGLALWSRAAMAAYRRLTLHRRTAVVVSALAVGVAAAMMAATVNTAIWWGQVALHAPWFLHGTASGTPGSALDPQLALTAVVMLLAVVASLYGVVRIGRSWVDLRRSTG